jgi:hypothetical protein
MSHAPNRLAHANANNAARRPMVPSLLRERDPGQCFARFVCDVNDIGRRASPHERKVRERPPGRTASSIRSST